MSEVEDVYFARGRKPNTEESSKPKKKKILKPNSRKVLTVEPEENSDGLTPYQRRSEKRLTLGNTSREARGWINSARTIQRMIK